MGLQLGFAFWILLITTIILVKSVSKRVKVHKHFFIFFLLLLVTSIFFSTDVSKTVWQFIPAKDYIQFPWRLLFVATFAGASLSGLIITLFIRKKFQIIFAALLI